MASKNVDQQSTAVEPKSKILKLDQSENDINADCPLFQLPDDILAKIIGYVPITQWPDMELVSTKFRDVTHLSWRLLRHVNLDVDFKYEPISNVVEIWDEKFMPSIECVLEKLVERAPFIKSLKGIKFQVDDPDLNASAVDLLSKFENLEAIGFSRQRIRLYPRSFLHRPARTSARMSTGGCLIRDMNLEIRLEDLITFMESTRSRTKLKEIEVERYVVKDIDGFWDVFARRMQANLVSNAEDRQRMRMEKLVINGATDDEWDVPPVDSWQNIFTLFDNSTLTSLSMGSTLVVPELLSNVIESAPNLRHFGFAIMRCPEETVKDPHEEDYKRLMTSLATHPNMNELYFFESPSADDLYDLGDYWEIDTEFVQMLKSIGPRLRLFGLDTMFGDVFDDDIVDQIADIIYHYMPALKSIHLRVDAMGTEDIKNIVRLPELEEISLQCDDRSINDDIIATIGQSTRLKSLRLCGFDDDSSPTFMGLATLTTLTKLEIKDADGNNSISSDVLVAWGNGFGSTLEELRLAGISDDARPGLIDLIKKADRLRVLDLQEATITNGILRAVASSCPNIEYIGAVRIVKSNLIAVQRVIDACPKLSTIRTEPIGRQDLRAQLKIDKYQNIHIH